MKPSYIVLALLALNAAPAFAQASDNTFSISGVADLNLRRLDNSNTSDTLVGSNGYNTSRVVIQAGHKVNSTTQVSVFLDHAVELANGKFNGANATESRFWHRRSSLSLNNTDLGELRLGRFLVAQYLGYGNFDPLGDVGVGGASNITDTLGSGIDAQYRSDRTIAYFAPTNRLGLYAQVDASLSAATDAPTGSATPNRSYRGGLVGWKGGPIDVAAAYGQTDITGGRFTSSTLAASYQAGITKLTGHVHAAENTATGKKRLRWLVGTNVAVGAGEVRASLSRSDTSGAGASADDANQIAIGYVHNLDSQTALYTTYSHISNSGKAAFGASGALAAVAGKAYSGLDLGVRYAF